MSNSLAAMRPELVREWSEKNLPLTPESVTHCYLMNGAFFRMF